jgi:16S rRNA (uracil1498-N3)-methyltransferase
VGRRRENERGRPPAGDPEQVLFVDERPAVGGVARLCGGDAEHARRSLRLRTGDAIALVDGKGTRFRGRVASLGKGHMDVTVDREESIPVWPSREIWMGMGVLRSTRMDVVVEKGSELGLSRFVPLVLERSVSRPREEGMKEERWHRLAVESLKQSRRACLMTVAPPTGLEEFLASLPSPRTLWVADPEGVPPAPPARGGEGGMVLLVGPEGGLTQGERDLLARGGASFISLGKHRLRAETAALTLLVTALSALGEVGPSPPRG